MDKKVKISIIVLIIVMLIVAVVITAYYVLDNKNQLENMTNDVSQNILNNEQENAILEVVNEIQVIQNVSVNATVPSDSNVVTGSEEDLVEKAINIVKQDWGEDDTVYFDYAGIDNEGRYVISVHNKETTQVLEWYNVNTTTGQFFKQ